MDLEERTFSKFYPTKLDDTTYIPKSHGVKITDFRLMPNFFYDLGIKSPSVECGQRRYELSFINQTPLNEDLPENYFRGILGESLMRILIMEFLSRKQKTLGIKQFSMIKNNPQFPISRKTENYFLKHRSRYNIATHLNTNVENAIAEYDGIISYSTNQTKGLIVMESKTGQEGIFLNPEHSKNKILEKYVYSLKELFPDHQIDFLFMGPENKILEQPFKKRILRSNLVSLNNLLNNENIGLLAFEFPISKNKLQTMGCRMASHHTLRNEAIPSSNSEYHYLENGKHIWFLKGKRITKIIEKTENNMWEEIYSIK